MTLGGCHCGYVVPAAPTVNLATGDLEQPVAGDFQICSGCGDVLIFALGTWRPATIVEVCSAAPLTRALLARCSKAMHQAIARVPGAGAGGMVN